MEESFYAKSWSKDVSVHAEATHLDFRICICMKVKPYQQPACCQCNVSLTPASVTVPTASRTDFRSLWQCHFFFFQFHQLSSTMQLFLVLSSFYLFIVSSLSLKTWIFTFNIFWTCKLQPLHRRDLSLQTQMWHEVQYRPTCLPMCHISIKEKGN